MLILWASLASINKFLELVWSITHWEIMGLHIKEVYGEDEDEDDEDKKRLFNKEVNSFVAMSGILLFGSLMGIRIFSSLEPNRFLGQDWIQMLSDMSKIGALLTAVLLIAALAIGFRTGPVVPKAQK
jgi:hypothetical protein